MDHGQLFNLSITVEKNSYDVLIRTETHGLSMDTLKLTTELKFMNLIATIGIKGVLIVQMKFMTRDGLLKLWTLIF
jgi:hypothetical protein